MPKTRVEADWREACDWQRLRAVIETSALDTIEREAMDQAGVTIGDEDLMRYGIECERAKRWS